MNQMPPDLLATGLAWLDPDLALCWLNPALAEALALGARSAAGLPLEAWLHDADLPAQAAALRAHPHAVQWRGLTLLAGPQGQERRVDVAVQPYQDGLLLEVHLLAAPAWVGSPLSATLRGFAHEVKNPLAGLRGAAQLLERRVGDDDLKALARLVIDEADRLAALAGRLLHQPGVSRWERFNIHAVLERLDALLAAEPGAPARRHDYDPSLPEVSGDPDRLLQLVLNLARNANDAGARHLLLRTRVEQALPPGGRLPRGALRLEVIDDGVGIAPGLRDALFEPLVSGRADGSGLGLALARETAREHGGELACLGSRPGETIFALYLPLERERVTEATA